MNFCKIGQKTRNLYSRNFLPIKVGIIREHILNSHKGHTLKEEILADFFLPNFDFFPDP